MASGRAGDGGDRVVAVLRERIASHALPPGAKIRELEVARELGVSRARVRNALLLLEERGLVERIPNRGAVVLKLDGGQVQALYDVRAALEGLAVRRATERAPAGHWAAHVERFAAIDPDAFRGGSFEPYAAAIDALREATVAAAGNPLLADMLDGVYDRARRVMRMVMILPGRAEVGLGQHRAMLAAMAAGDADEAERLKRAIIRDGLECLRRYEGFIL